MKTISILVISVVLGLMGVTHAATPIAINNFSFENESGYPHYSTPTGWTKESSVADGIVGDLAMVDEGVTGGDGTHCAYFNYVGSIPFAGLYQDTAATFIPGNRYTFTVALCNRASGAPANVDIFWKISLHHADTDREIASTWGTALYVNRGVLVDVTLSNYVASAADAGKTIRVRISRGPGNWQFCADNVRLSYEASTEPELVRPLHIVNPSFEEDYVYPHYVNPPSWSRGGGGAEGILGSIAATSPGITGGEGLNNLYMNSAAGGVVAYQNTLAPLVEGCRYTLTAAIGLPSTSVPDGNMPWKLSLCDAATSNEIACAQGRSFLTEAGVFRDYSLPGYVASAADAGKVIQVRVYNAHTGTGQLQVDNVRLTQERGNWVSIVNHSFEAELPAPSTPNYILQAPTGWTMTGSVVADRTGVIRSSAFSLSGGQGEYSVYLNPRTGADTNYVALVQNTGHLESSWKYQLTAAMAVRGDLASDCPWKISLNDAVTGEELTATNGTVTSRGTFADYSTPFFIAKSGDADKTLQVRLVNMTSVGSAQLAIDNVRLERVPLPRGTVITVK